MVGLGEGPTPDPWRSALPFAAEVPIESSRTLAVSGGLAPRATWWVWVPSGLVEVAIGRKSALAPGPQSRADRIWSRACAEYCACVNGQPAQAAAGEGSPRRRPMLRSK